jgi:hypothetical protein
MGINPLISLWNSQFRSLLWDCVLVSPATTTSGAAGDITLQFAFLYPSGPAFDPVDLGFGGGIVGVDHVVNDNSDSLLFVQP